MRGPGEPTRTPRGQPQSWLCRPRKAASGLGLAGLWGALVTPGPRGPPPPTHAQHWEHVAASVNARRGRCRAEKPDREAKRGARPGQHVTCPGREGTSRRRGAGSQKHFWARWAQTAEQGWALETKASSAPGAQAARPPKALAGGTAAETTLHPVDVAQSGGQQCLGWFWRRSV